MIKWLLIEWQYQSNGTIHLQLITYVIITDYILATVLNSSFTILSIGRGLFMCPLAHAAFAIFQKRGRFYNGRGASIKGGVYMFPHPLFQFY